MLHYMYINGCQQEGRLSEDSSVFNNGGFKALMILIVTRKLRQMLNMKLYCNLKNTVIYVKVKHKYVYQRKGEM